MKVTVHFTDGEVIDAGSDAVTLSKMGFPITPDGAGNNEVIWISLAAIKYVTIQNPNPNPLPADPREGRDHRKVVLRFLDGETIRTYEDENFGHEQEGFNCLVYDGKEKRLSRVLISLHALKGLFYVKEWDSRKTEERIQFLGRKKPAPVETKRATPLDDNKPVDPRIAELADSYRQRLALVRDSDLSSRDPAAFERSLRANLERLLLEDAVRLDEAEKAQVLHQLLKSALGYGPLDRLLADPSVSEIMVNAIDQIFIEREGKLAQTPYRFEDSGQLLNVIRRIVAQTGRTIDEVHPMVDARMPDGSRVNAIIPPAALKGPTLTIRKFHDSGISLDQLVKFGTLSPSMALFLHAAVQGRLNILISGGTGSGKTTTLNMLASLVPDDQRIVTIEDAAELQIIHPHVIPLEYRPPNVEGKGELTIRALLKNSLRMRPDRIIVGEVRSGEALDMLQAMNTGHDGTMSTIHSNSAGDAVSRLETMVLSGSVDLPVEAIRTQIVRGINLMVHQARMPDGRRKIVQISELTGYDAKGPVLRDIYVLKSSQEGLEYIATGAVPSCLDKCAFYGVTVPAELFDPVAARYSPAGSDAAMPVRPTASVARAEADVRVVPVVLQVTQAQVNQAQAAAAAPSPAPADSEQAAPNGTPEGAQVVPVVLPAPTAPVPPSPASPAPARPAIAPDLEYAGGSTTTWGQTSEHSAPVHEEPAQFSGQDYDPLPLPTVGGHLTHQIAESLELRGLHPRLAAGLAFVHGGHTLQAGTYMRLARVTPAIAGRDLRSAVRAGLLAEDPDGRGGYRAGENLDELIRSGFEDPAAPEPAAV